jgi:alanyl-tRNA synthetase
MRLDVRPRRPLPHSAALRHRVAAAPDMAQAGGTSPEKLPQALASVRGWVEERL